MGTSADSIWVRVAAPDGDAVAARRVAAAVSGVALVAPPRHGWVTVFPAEAGYGDPAAARARTT
jgi:hypothetical protein